MRKLSKKMTIAAAATAVAVAGTGVAFGWWSTTGSGTGTGATTAGVTDTLAFDQDLLTAMYPGDEEQDLTVTITNTDLLQHVWVATVKAYVETDMAGCDGDDFLLDGVVAPSTAATAAELDWTPMELLSNAATSGDATGTIQFNDKPTTNQDACKGAAVTIHYLAS